MPCAAGPAVSEPDALKGKGECIMKESDLPRRNVRRPAMNTGCSHWAPIDLTAGEGSKAASAAQGRGERKCSRCIHFIMESNTCRRVAGQISPEGGCALWAGQA